MKVVHLCNLPLPSSHPDTSKIKLHPGKWVFNLAYAQKKYTAVDPEIIVQVAGASTNFSYQEKEIPIHYISAPKGYRAPTFFSFDSKRIKKKLLSLKPNLIHGHGTEDAYAISAQRAPYPYCITAQGLHFMINRELPPPLISRRNLIQLIEHTTLSQAQDVIAKSKHVQSELQSKFPHLKLHHIPNTFDPSLLNIEAHKESNLVAYVGTIDKRKGIDIIVNAMEIVRKKIPDIRLWIFGDNPNPVWDYEIEQKDKLNQLMGSHVTFHGKVAPLEVAKHVAKANLLIAPSREEMFGNQVIEALLVGTPCIVTEKTAMAENINSLGSGKIIKQENPTDLAQAIIQLLTTPSTIPLDELKQTKSLIIEKMGPQIVAEKHAILYKKIIDSFSKN